MEQSRSPRRELALGYGLPLLVCLVGALAWDLLDQHVWTGNTCVGASEAAEHTHTRQSALVWLPTLLVYVLVVAYLTLAKRLGSRRVLVVTVLAAAATYVLSGVGPLYTSEWIELLRIGLGLLLVGAALAIGCALAMLILVPKARSAQPLLLNTALVIFFPLTMAWVIGTSRASGAFFGC